MVEQVILEEKDMVWAKVQLLDMIPETDRDYFVFDWQIKTDYYRHRHFTVKYKGGYGREWKRFIRSWKNREDVVGKTGFRFTDLHRQALRGIEESRMREEKRNERQAFGDKVILLLKELCDTNENDFEAGSYGHIHIKEKRNLEVRYHYPKTKVSFNRQGDEDIYQVDLRLRTPNGDEANVALTMQAMLELFEMVEAKNKSFESEIEEAE